MKVQSIGKPHTAGSSTLEILIATAIIVVTLTAVIGLVFGNQSIAIDTQTNHEALYLAQTEFETVHSLAQKDFLAASSTSPVVKTSGALAYTLQTTIADLGQCQKSATNTISWNTSPSRTQTISFTTLLSDVSGAVARGGDCARTFQTNSAWDNPQRFASDTTNPGKPTALDELNRIVYLGVDKSPFLKIADTHAATLGQTSGLFATYANSFNEEDNIYALDAVAWHDPLTHAVKTYAFAATGSTTAQLKVIDVTDINNPVVVARRTLAGVVSSGSFPQGWRLVYYKDRLYIVTRETSGPELHIFNVTMPSNPTELGSGTSLNLTVEDMSIQERNIAGARARYLFVATDDNTAEVKVFDVTDPSNNGTAAELMAARQDLVGTQDGASVFTIGNKLYVGRQSSSGADLFIYDCSNPAFGMPLLGSTDIGTGVIGVYITDRFAFLSTPKTNQEFQVWNISNPASITAIATYNFGNVINQGIDYHPNFIYATGQSTPNLQIIYSP